MSYQDRNSPSNQYVQRMELRKHPRMITVSDGAKQFLLVVIHIGLAFILREFQLATTLHAYIVLLIGLWIALTSTDIKKSITIAAYIVGSEILWRMTDANIFWEFGKYASTIILIISILKFRNIKKAGSPIIYFLLLIPSIAMTIQAFGFSGITQEHISFNLSGPLALCVFAIAFKQIKIEVKDLKPWLWATLYPIIGVFTIAAYNTITAPELSFASESVFVTSGGYGPNQVSSILGLGTMFLIILGVIEDKSRRKPWLLLLTLALLTQTLLTFSRGGVINILVTLPIAFLHLLGNSSKSIKGIFVLLIIILIAFFLILPELELFTGGALEARFSDFDTTGRSEIAESDIRLWIKNPIMGVGPGLSPELRDIEYDIAPHTEFSRMLSEHGFLGLISIVVLLSILITAYFQTPNISTRFFISAFAVWPLLQMLHGGMRIAAISFMVGLSVVNWEDEPNF